MAEALLVYGLVMFGIWGLPVSVAQSVLLGACVFYVAVVSRFVHRPTRASLGLPPPFHFTNFPNRGDTARESCFCRCIPSNVRSAATC